MCWTGRCWRRPQDRACVFQGRRLPGHASRPLGPGSDDAARRRQGDRAATLARRRGGGADAAGHPGEVQRSAGRRRVCARGRRSGGAPRRSLPRLRSGGDYAFCASRMAEARAAYMKARLDFLKKKPPQTRTDSRLLLVESGSAAFISRCASAKIFRTEIDASPFLPRP